MQQICARTCGFCIMQVGNNGLNPYNGYSGNNGYGPATGVITTPGDLATNCGAIAYLCNNPSYRSNMLRNCAGTCNMQLSLPPPPPHRTSYYGDDYYDYYSDDYSSSDYDDGYYSDDDCYDNGRRC